MRWVTFLLVFALGEISEILALPIYTRSVCFYDEQRRREIPAIIYSSSEDGAGSRVTIISGGYGIAADEYAFIAAELVAKGFLVLSLRHELPGDAPLPVEGDLAKARRPDWERGVANIRFMLSAVKRDYPKLDLGRTVLVGHSNGGDISALFAALFPSEVSAVITMDHRRMPVPRVKQPRILSIRADEFEADAGVLPNDEEARMLGIRVVRLVHTKHIGLSERGDDETKKAVVRLISGFID